MMDLIGSSFKKINSKMRCCSGMLWAAGLMILLTSCASTPRVQNEPLLIASELFFQLLPSNVFAQAINVTQQVTMEYKGKKNIFIARIEVDASGFVVVAMSELGQTIFTLQYRDNQLIIDKAMVLARLPDLKYLLGDLQIIFWPSVLLQNQLLHTSAELVETYDADLLRRRSIQRQGHTLIDVEYSGGAGFASDVRFTHLERGYSIAAKVLALD